jgi:hypothetical protein
MLIPRKNNESFKDRGRKLVQAKHITWMKTVKIMTIRVVVTNIGRDPTMSSSSISTIEKAIAPRNPPYAMMNCSCMLIFFTRSLFVSQVNRNTPVHITAQVKLTAATKQ